MSRPGQQREFAWDEPTPAAAQPPDVPSSSQRAPATDAELAPAADSGKNSAAGPDPQFELDTNAQQGATTVGAEISSGAEIHSGADLPSGDAPSLATVAGRTVYVIDAHSLIFQVFHALPEMTSPRGEPVGAVYGFARDIFYLLEQKKPDYLICSFDLPGPTFRHELYDQYKVHREEMPESLRPQIPAIQRFLTAMAIPIVTHPGQEADDCLATLSQQIAQAGGKCILVTGDKDCRQLVNEAVTLYNIRKNEMMDAAGVEADWGIRPDQVIDYQALVGDAVDNVPGVPLIGPKIASQLLQQYGSLAGIYAHLHELKGKRRDNLVQYEQQAWLSRDLARLRCDLPLTTDWLRYAPGQYDRQAVLELFREFGFKGLAEKVGGQLPAEPTEPQVRGTYHLVATQPAFLDFLAQLRQQPRFAIDTETTHVRPRWAELVGLSFSWQAGEGYYVPVRAPAGQPQLPVDWVLKELRPLLTDPQVGKIGQNLKYDAIVLKNHGIELAGLQFDTMLASYLLNAGERSHSLDELSKLYLKTTPIPITDLIGTGKQQKLMSEVDVDKICEYAAEDADLSWRLYEQLQPLLAQAGLNSLFDDLEMPLVSVLVDLEYNGIAVDPTILRRLSGEFQQALDRLQEVIFQLAGHPFNLGSPKQLAEVLFQELKLPVVKKTKTGPSTDAEVLEELASQHELPRQIMEHRQYAKLKSTYVDALTELIHPQTQRVHTSFNQVVAATGRLSSNDPNLQNIPVRSEAGRQIRAAFHAAPADWELICADYSQIELRVLAHYSQDPALLSAFAEDQDIHAAVAAEVYRVPLAEVTREMRHRAKAVNFGVIYGQSAFGLAKSLGIPQEEAAAFIDSYFQRYPGVIEFMENLLADCSQSGYVTTIFGRRREVRGVRAPRSPRPAPPTPPTLDADPRPLPNEVDAATAIGTHESDVPASSPSAKSTPESPRWSSRSRSLPERTAINTVIQGSAADLIKRAMVRLHARLRDEQVPARMLLQIHDELVLEGPSAQRDRIAQILQAEMVGVAALSVPLKVDVKIGFDWAHCQPWHSAE